MPGHFLSHPRRSFMANAPLIPRARNQRLTRVLVTGQDLYHPHMQAQQDTHKS